MHRTCPQDPQGPRLGESLSQLYKVHVKNMGKFYGVSCEEEKMGTCFPLFQCGILLAPRPSALQLAWALAAIGPELKSA